MLHRLPAEGTEDQDSKGIRARAAAVAAEVQTLLSISVSSSVAAARVSVVVGGGGGAAAAAADVSELIAQCEILPKRLLRKVPPHYHPAWSPLVHRFSVQEHKHPS